MKSKTHRISIPSIVEIDNGVTDRVGKLFKNHDFKDVLIVTDKTMYEILAPRLVKSLESENIKVEVKIIDESLQIEELTKYALTLSGDIDVVLGVGGGSVLDKAKYASFIRKKVYVSMTTAPSNDGFLSPVASLYIDDKRTTVPAKIPYGVIADIDVIKQVPMHMIYSGIGDCVSNYTAVYDMYYEDERREHITVDKFSTMSSRRSIDSLMSVGNLDLRSDEFMTSLLEALTMNGVAMEIAGTSSPSSGSEHLISHAMDAILGKDNYPHGIQVGVATYIISKIQNHKVEEINDFFTKTGFWDFVKTLNIKKSVICEAIDKAPSIKKYRATVIHDEDNRVQAKFIVNNDELLNDILV